MNERLSQDRVSQNDVTDKNGRYIRDRHSRLVEQNRRMERERQRNRAASLLIMGLATLLSITPVSNAVKNFLHGNNNHSEASAPSAASDSSGLNIEVLTANPVKADMNNGTTKEETLSTAASAANDNSSKSSSSKKSSSQKKKKNTAAKDSSKKAGEKNAADKEQAATPQIAVMDPASDAAQTANNYLMLHTVMGPMLYYNQADPLWRDYLWGGTDTFHEYGCGPTACAMIANSFGNSTDQITPIAMAEWAVNDHDFARGSGSYNTLIPNSLTAYGLTVVSKQDSISVDTICEELRSGHLLVCLMGPGDFTDSGHFIILTALHEDGTISVADPVSLERTKTSYDPALIVSQLDSGRSNGAPIWAVSL
jgi:hypothetical protein